MEQSPPQSSCPSARHRDCDQILRHGQRDGESRRRCWAESTTASTSARTCSAVFDRPSENRRLARARSATVEGGQHVRGSTGPLEHAEPVETAKPLKSSDEH
jgi:hypothetical protein